MTVRFRIERDECILCGACWDVCPQVFEEDLDEGLSQVVEQYRRDGDPAAGQVPDDLEECVRNAAADCPVEIIQVE